MSEAKNRRRGGSEEGRGQRNEFARETRTVSALKTTVIYAFSIGASARARRFVGGGSNKRAKNGELQFQDWFCHFQVFND